MVQRISSMQVPEHRFDVMIAGAGPAGSSAAIHLASHGMRVLLVEQKKFPRSKLCGEFISPECLDHFRRLGVAQRMFYSGGASLIRTVFYSRQGRSVMVPSNWFGADAMGLSRAEMDNNLLRRARELGVTVLEEAQPTNLLWRDTRVIGARIKCGDTETVYKSLVTIDATGRNQSLARRSGQGKNASKKRPPFVAFKAHLENVRTAKRTCEIYSYPGGYGGLSGIENGLSNLCFIISTKDVRRCHSDPEMILREIVSKNPRAAHTLANARVQSAWLSVALENFGRHRLVPATGMLAIGDAAAFIDPFTGSGMLMALESGELAAGLLFKHLPHLRAGGSFEPIADDYRKAYAGTFGARLRVCGLLRRAAFVPRLAEAAIRFFGASERLRRKLACATRTTNGTRVRVED